MTKMEQLAMDIVEHGFAYGEPGVKEFDEVCRRAKEAIEEMCERNGWEIRETYTKGHYHVECRIRNKDLREIIVYHQKISILTVQNFEDVRIKYCAVLRGKRGTTLGVHPSQLEETLLETFKTIKV